LRIKSCEKLKTKSFDDFGKNIDIYWYGGSIELPSLFLLWIYHDKKYFAVYFFSIT
jgi:hypothetical protein